MTPSNAKEADKSATGEGPALSAAAVAAFLKRHPDFFVKHSRLLTQLDLPHECGDAVSLVEYQVSVLREQNLRLRHQLDSLVATARDNEALIRRLHRLTLDLLACRDLAMALDVLDDAIRAGFKAEFAAVRLLMAAPAEDRGRPEFVGDDDGITALYGAVLHAQAPTCGRIGPGLAASLFGDAAAEVGSAVVAPLGQAERFGVLAIGSRDAARFQPGMGTLFVRQLADVAANVVQRYLR